MFSLDIEKATAPFVEKLGEIVERLDRVIELLEDIKSQSGKF